ncbi:MAG: spore maturation protein [Limnochordia bacterium]|jgi:spore maturation protein B
MMGGFLQIMDIISRWAIPLLLLGIPFFGYLRGVAVYEAFVAGAKEGVQIALRILPYLIAMFFAIEIFRRSGAMDALLSWATPLAEFLQAPKEVLPLAFLRPLSGSGSLGMLSQLLHQYGPDSIIGLTASALMGSTETTFYVLTVYLGSVGIKDARHCLSCALIADVAGFLAAVILVRLMLGL